MNPLKTILFLSVSLFSLTLFSQDIDRSNYSLLWEITGKNLTEPSYLYGTMHVQDERAHDFPDSLFIALENTQAFAMEVDPDSTVSSMLKGIMGEKYDNTLKEKLSPAAYEKLTAEFFEQTGMSLDSFAMFNSEEAIANELTPFSEPDDVVKKPNAVDFYLYQCAFYADKSLHGLEEMADYQSSNEALFRVFEQDDVPDFGASEEQRRAQYDKMIKMYQEGDIEAMYAYSKQNKAYDEYNKAMLDARNQNMATGIIDLFETEKSVFVAVGAAHLGGEQGVVKLLRKQGYNLRKMQPVFTEKGKNYTFQNKRSRDWKTHHIKGTRVQLDFPLQPEKMNNEEDEMSDFLELYGVFDFVAMNAYMVMALESPTGQMDMSDDQLKEMIKGMSQSMSLKKAIKIKKMKTASGQPSFVSNFVDEEGNYHAQQTFTDDKSVYILWYVRLFSEEPTADKERFFKSFQYANIPPPPPPPPGESVNTVYHFENKEQGYSVKMPRKPFETVNYQTVEVFEGRNGSLKTTQNVAIDTDGASYLVQHILRPLGQKTENDSLAVTSTANIINKQHKALKEPQFFREKEVMGMDLYNEMKGGQQLRSRAIVRGPHNYFLAYSGDDIYSEDADNFFNSFKLLPFTEEEMERINPEGELYSINLPVQYFVTQRGENKEEKIVESSELVALDTLSGIGYVITRTTYMPYTEFGDKDAYFQSVVDVNTKSGKVEFLSKKEENGITKLNLNMLSPATKTYSISQFFYIGNVGYELTASLPSEAYTASAERFFASFQETSKGDTEALFQSKAKAILEDLTAKETAISTRAIKATDTYEFTADDLPLIRKILAEKNYQQDTVEQLLLREFIYNTDAESLSFIEKYFTENKDIGLESQRFILFAMNIKGEEAGRKAFFKNADNWEKNAERQHFDYEDLFAPYYDSTALFVAHLDDLLPWLEHKQFAVETANVFSFHAKNMRENRDILLAPRDTIFAKAKQIATKYKLFEDPKASKDFAEYKLFDALNFFLTDISPTTEIEDYFKDFYKFDDAYLILGAIRYYASEQIPFNPVMVQKIFDSPYDRIYLFQYAENFFGDLQMLPQEYVSQETVTETYVYRSIFDKYGTLSSYKPMKTERYKKGEKEYLLHLFLFQLEGNENEYFGVVSQPADGTVNVFPDLFNYHTGAWDKSLTEGMMQEIKEYWEKED